MKKVTAIICLALVSLPAGFLSRGAISFMGAYSQDFDSLPSTEGNYTWADNSTVTGWYANQTSYTANHGNSSSVSLYDFGSSASSDRALGSVTGSSATTIYYGVALQNGTGGTIKDLQIGYQGEQWRLGNGNVTDTLTFQYLIGDPSGNNIANGTWTTVSSLNFVSPQIGASGSSLDGNSTANSSTISYTITGLNIPNGTDIWFRWLDNDVAGNDAGLAIDNFSISEIPEPAEWSALSAVALLGICALREWRQRKLTCVA